jgi:hypothetical protein
MTQAEHFTLACWFARGIGKPEFTKNRTIRRNIASIYAIQN